MAFTVKIGSNLSPQDMNFFVNDLLNRVPSGTNELILDLSECQFLNSMMLSGLLNLLKACREKSIQLTLINVGTSAYMLFETTNVLELFKVDVNSLRKQDPPDLNLSVQRLNPSQVVFTLGGGLHSSQQCARFRESYEEVLPDFSDAVLDLSQLHHLGSAGVTEMFRLRGLLQEKAGHLVIVSGTDSVESVWRMMHLSSLIPKVASLEAGIKVIKQWSVK